MKTIILTLIMLTGLQSQALTIRSNPFIEVTNQKYKTVSVSAENVDGVYVSLKADVLKDDCNAKSLIMDKALVSGSGEGFYDKYILDAYIVSTEMYCPSLTPAFEVVKSEKVFFKSFTNRHANGEIEIKFIIPEDFELIVEVVHRK